MAARESATRLVSSNAESRTIGIDPRRFVPSRYSAIPVRVWRPSGTRPIAARPLRTKEKVFPELREYCQQHGARFQAIDLRWGVSQEAALDQQTMNICIQELRRCQERGQNTADLERRLARAQQQHFQARLDIDRTAPD